MEEIKVKRKGYKTQAQQTEATRKYLANNPEAKARAQKSRNKSTAKSYIRKANKEELEEIKEVVEQREEELKHEEKK